jgi:hypothetical protein
MSKLGIRRVASGAGDRQHLFSETLRQLESDWQ